MTTSETFETLAVTLDAGVLCVELARPERVNAISKRMCAELASVASRSSSDADVRAVMFTGRGRAFCAGADISELAAYTSVSEPLDHISLLQRAYNALEELEKPTIAAIHGFAIGGGNVLQVLCDLTIAADTAKFGQVGPKVGSVDPGFGTAYLTHVVGEKKAREMWYRCEQYTAEQAVVMGLANKVVPAATLMAEARAWGTKIVAMSPTAIKLAKQSFNSETEHIRSTSALGVTAATLYYGSEEAMEGKRAFAERRKPDFRKFRV